MAAPVDEDEEPIYTLASECEKLFEEGTFEVNLRASEAVHLWQECQERFTAWSAYLGVFARQNLCLDRRLQHHPELQDLVLRLLDILRINLVQGRQVARFISSVRILFLAPNSLSSR